ncbi:hypothetical protein KUV89_16335 [Marinobacter hydrocarbonoclasticus]|nr:hypothetical protein [Marinobacter nauticus]
MLLQLMAVLLGLAVLMVMGAVLIPMTRTGQAMVARIRSGPVPQGQKKSRQGRDWKRNAIPL